MSEDSEDFPDATVFDPKAFLESLFHTRKAEIHLILNNNTTESIGQSENSTLEDIIDDHEEERNKFDFNPDVYFVIGAVSFIVLILLCTAIYKAIVMLKVSLRDGLDDSIPVPDQPQPQQPPDASQQPLTANHFFHGLRQFHVNLATATATLRSRVSIKSEDDLPPPYNAEEFAQARNNSEAVGDSEQSPPPYHVAIAMIEDHEDEEVTVNYGNDYDNDETDSRVNFAAKNVAVVRLKKISK